MAFQRNRYSKNKQGQGEDKKSEAYIASAQKLEPEVERRCEDIQVFMNVEKVVGAEVYAQFKIRMNDHFKLYLAEYKDRKTAASKFNQYYSILDVTSFPNAVGAFIASEVNNEALFNLLVDKVMRNGNSINYVLGDNEITLLHMACKQGYVSAVKKILEKIDKVKTDKDNMTPLFSLIFHFSKIKDFDLDSNPNYKKVFEMLIQEMSREDVLSLKSIFKDYEEFENESHLTLYDGLFKTMRSLINSKFKTFYTDEFKKEMKSIDLDMFDDEKYRAELKEIIDKSNKIKISLLKSIDSKEDAIEFKKSSTYEKDILFLQDSLKRLNQLTVSVTNHESYQYATQFLNHLIDLLEVQHLFDLETLACQYHDDSAMSLLKEYELNKLRTLYWEINKNVISHNQYSPGSEVVLLRYILAIKEKMKILKDEMSDKVGNKEIMEKLKSELDSELGIAFNLTEFSIKTRGSHSNKNESEAMGLTFSDDSHLNESIAKGALVYAKNSILASSSRTVLSSPYQDEVFYQYSKGVQDVRANIVGMDKKGSPLKSNEYENMGMVTRIDPDDAIFVRQYYLDMIKKYSLGNCYEFALLAMDYVASYNAELKEESKISVKLCSIKNGDHSFVLIGCQKDSKPDDPSTWGENAYICDPWSNKVYKAADYRKQLKNYIDETVVDAKDINEHSLEPLNEKQGIAFKEEAKVEFFVKRNDPNYIKRVYSFYQLKLQAISDILKDLDDQLKLVLKDKIGSDVDKNPVLKVLTDKLDEVKALREKVLDYHRVDLGFMLLGKSSSLNGYPMNDYTFVKSNCQEILKSLIQSSFRLINTLTIKNPQSVSTMIQNSKHYSDLLQLEPMIEGVRKQFVDGIAKLEEMTLPAVAEKQEESKENKLDGEIAGSSSSLRLADKRRNSVFASNDSQLSTSVSNSVKSPKDASSPDGREKNKNRLT